MKKISIYTLLSSTILLSSACGPTTKPECSYPGSDNMAAPTWICDQSAIKGYSLTAIGIGEKSPAGPAFTKSEAMMDARLNLSKKASAQTKGVEKTTTKSSKNDRWSTVKKSRLSAKLVNKLIKVHTAPDGRVFVLLGIPNK